MKTDQILADLDMQLGTAQKSSVRLAYRLADDEGTIQAGDMLKLTSDPTKHTTTDLRRALRMLGCEYAK